MLRDILTLSALILAVLLVRAAFKNRVPKRMIYCLWLVVLLKLCLPGTLFSLPVLPAAEGTAPVQTVQTTPVVSTASTIPAPSTTTVQPTAPVQTTTQPETKPETQPMTPAVQETAKTGGKAFDHGADFANRLVQRQRTARSLAVWYMADVHDSAPQR